MLAEKNLLEKSPYLRGILTLPGCLPLSCRAQVLIKSLYKICSLLLSTFSSTSSSFLFTFVLPCFLLSFLSLFFSIFFLFLFLASIFFLLLSSLPFFLSLFLSFFVSFFPCQSLLDYFHLSLSPLCRLVLITRSLLSIIQLLHLSLRRLDSLIKHVDKSDPSPL